MIKHVFLDLDETVFDFKRSEAQALSRTLTSLGVPVDDNVVRRYSEINAAQWKLLEKGEITRADLLTRRFRLLYEELSLPDRSCETQKLYEQYLSRSFYFLPGAEELLRELSLKYDLYLASNGTAKVQDGRIKSSGIEKYFKDIFISQRIGYNKPDMRFFEKCFLKIPDFSGESAVIVGDSLSSDIKGGLAAGIHTVWYNPSGMTNDSDIKPEFEFRALSELAALLEKI